MYSEIASVKSNKMIADNIYEAILYSPNISSKSKPGQFINILPNKNWSNVMRRPMSIASQGNDLISIIYKVFGEGTRIISNWKKGDRIDLIGPLGNIWTDYDSKYPILVAGGVGIAPILNLHNYLKEIGIKHALICGAKTKKEHFLEHNPENDIFLSTDIDEYGIKGNVINAIDIVLRNKKINSIKIFSCGPHGMLRGVHQYSKLNNYECQIAVETIMACGIGICQGCTIIKKEIDAKHTYRNKYALACIDGPVFNGSEISDAF